MIAQSVGSRGVNNVDDVVIIQCALVAFRLRNSQGAIAIDGLVGPETTGAITDFQRRQSLPADGRIDVDGPTLPRLTTLIGGEEGVYGPTIARLLPLVDALRDVARVAPISVRARIARMANGYEDLNRVRDLAAGLGNGGGGDPGGITLVGFAGGPRVFGFVGVDDAAEAAAVAAMALILAILLVLLIQSPAFRHEVGIRAKELDRILKSLQINANTGLKDAVDLIVAIANGEIEEANRCKQSPTFLPSPECFEAMRVFAATAAGLKKLVAILFQLVLSLTTQRTRFSDIQALRVRFNAVLKSARQEIVNLQVDLAHMREVCKCPDT